MNANQLVRLAIGGSLALWAVTQRGGAVKTVARVAAGVIGINTLAEELMGQKVIPF